ncbi:hypothetical protein AVEN_219698-1 [Araneus ventricosus]|uniref:Uncharacterized protein n=1 Tax=Araneus ventricosus TaxID=182803 RepID=A0A4Y2UZ51_ARAVE|nr:hypothetical protein AVEN_210193-1 [Araneus ventricosus]GBO17547.1 hypothetical protein AVEN_172268-1 [Araneus ventricosus]GBO17549.1 hypothetical protein AVEN_186942-1 [Araneus ventricosus]GBO17552.1 hypothetical protein AVEN_219698-1 [Araneus ventricosus]
MYQREQILFTIMLTMIKDHVIKYHKKTSPLPALAPWSTLNDWPPRLHRALWSPHNSPHHERLIRRPPILPGYDPSSEMGPKSHTTITVSTKAARTCLLIRQLLIRELRHTGIM